MEDIYANHAEAVYRLPRIDKPMPMSTGELNDLLLQPLSVETAERISIEANPIVKTKVAALGIAEADYAQAGRMEKILG